METTPFNFWPTVFCTYCSTIRLLVRFVVRLSICLSACNVCIVAKRYIIRVADSTVK